MSDQEQLFSPEFDFALENNASHSAEPGKLPITAQEAWSTPVTSSPRNSEQRKNITKSKRGRLLNAVALGRHRSNSDCSLTPYLKRKRDEGAGAHLLGYQRKKSSSSPGLSSPVLLLSLLALPLASIRKESSALKEAVGNINMAGTGDKSQLSPQRLSGDTNQDPNLAIFSRIDQMTERLEKIFSNQIQALFVSNEKQFSEVRSLIDQKSEEWKDLLKSFENRVAACEAAHFQIASDVARDRAATSAEVNSKLTEVNSSMADLEHTVSSYKSEISDLRSLLAAHDRTLKRNNVIVRGINRSNANVKVDVERFFETEFGISDCVVEARLLNEKRNTIVAKLSNYTTKQTIMKTKKAILGAKQYYINDDLSQADAATAKHLRDMRRSLKDEGKADIKLGFNKIQIDGIWYYWDSVQEKLKPSARPSRKAQDSSGTRSNTAASDANLEGSATALQIQNRGAACVMMTSSNTANDMKISHNNAIVNKNGKKN